MLGAISFITLGAFADGIDPEEHVCLFVSPLFYIILLFGVICIGCEHLWDNTIGKLNEFLDKDEK